MILAGEIKLILEHYCNTRVGTSMLQWINNINSPLGFDPRMIIRQNRIVLRNYFNVRLVSKGNSICLNGHNFGKKGLKENDSNDPMSRAPALILVSIYAALINLHWCANNITLGLKVMVEGRVLFHLPTDSIRH